MNKIETALTIFVVGQLLFDAFMLSNYEMNKRNIRKCKEASDRINSFLKDAVASLDRMRELVKEMNKDNEKSD